MSFPAQSTFASPAPWSAWWSYARDDGADLCAATGADVVAALRAALGLAPGDAWDDAVQAELVRRVREISAFQPGLEPVVAALERDAAAREVSPASLALGVWYALYRPLGLRLDALTIPPGATPPPFGVPLAAETPGQGVVCWRDGRDAAPAVLSAARIAEARAATAGGIRLRPGESPPTPYVPPPPPGAGLRGPALVAGGAALLVGAVVVASLIAKSGAKAASTPKRATANPRRRRGSR